MKSLVYNGFTIAIFQGFLARGTMTKDIIKVGIYTRVSTADQQTLPMQMQALKKYAKQRQWKVVMEIEETGSGANHRPQRELLLKAARRREIDNIIVWRLDRWGRSITDLLTTLEELAALKVGFISISEALDLTTATGKAMAGLLAVFAQFERDLLRERVKAGIAHAKEQGKSHGRPKTAALKQDLVKELFKKGYSKVKIAKELKIGRTSVRRLLKNLPKMAGKETPFLKQGLSKQKALNENKEMIALNTVPNNQDTSTVQVMDKSYYMGLFAKYKENRAMLSKFHLEKMHMDDIPENIMQQAITKLNIGHNRDIGDSYHAELNVIYDYCTLYHRENGETLLTSYLKQHSELLKGKLKKALQALMESYFTILRVDQILSGNAVRVFDYLRNDYYILMDEALNNTSKPGKHLVATLLDFKEYIMTSGGAILFDIDTYHYNGQKVIDIFNGHLTKTVDGKSTIKNLTQCVTDVFKYAIQEKIMRHQYVNDFKSPNYGLPMPSLEMALLGSSPGMALLDLMSMQPGRRKRKSSWRSSRRGFW
jgi:putative DNA-invertase from lambdoid prophage Rac